MNNKIGRVYLIHFERPYHHAKHYIGFTSIGERREKRHRRGDGAKLLRAVRLAGIEFKIVRLWRGDRHLERKLKNQKNAPKLCPMCKNLKKEKS